ncbi:PREDICTED: uncharacterized protein LOC104714445 [Camelina sativa]|uniref:Uncharacterized protein LOC104714445 n=1 Tax=Camelina sativa TaxID=90675 RepID=A0ABM1QFX8_CAMSA|nr:PREDICTED: uncharacterized protein LOC104714445 [Camelina sativa]
MRLCANIEFCFGELKTHFICPTQIEIGVYSKGVSVLMPGDHIPTFIGYPVPAPVLCVSNSRSSNPNSTIEEC